MAEEAPLLTHKGRCHCGGVAFEVRCARCTPGALPVRLFCGCVPHIARFILPANRPAAALSSCDAAACRLPLAAPRRAAPALTD